MATKIQIRRGTAASWTSTNPTLSSGELGLETDTNKVKIGDGSTAWNSLNYFYDQSALSQASASATYLSIINASATYIPLTSQQTIINTASAAAVAYADGLTTSDIAEGTNQYFTTQRAIDAASATYILQTSQQGIINSASAAAVSYLVDSAPGTLDTLNELAAALNDDANFSTTITNSLANKLDASSASSTYLTQSSASSTYAPIASPTFTGTVTIPTLDLTNALPIADGGTGQTTASAALNALLPTQTGNSGRYLTTDGNATSWVTVATSTQLATQIKYPVELRSDSHTAWEAGGYTGFGSVCTKIIHDKEKFIAIGDGGQQSNGKIRYSTNNLEWTDAITVGGTFIYALDYAKSGLKQYLAADTAGYIFRSTNGILWTSQTFTNNGYLTAHENGIWFIGINTYLGHSTDTISWTTVSVGFASTTGGQVNNIAYGNGRYVVGGDGFGVISTSTNLTNWTTVSTGFGNTYINRTGIIFGNDMFLLNSYNTTSKSTDGLSWTTVNTGFSSGNAFLHFADKTFFIAGQNSLIKSSTDLVTWTTKPFNSNTGSVVPIITMATGLDLAIIGVSGPSSYNTWHAPIKINKNYTLSSSDANNILEIDNPTEVNIFAPSNVTSSMNTGTSIDIVRTGTANINIRPQRQVVRELNTTWTTRSIFPTVTSSYVSDIVHKNDIFVASGNYGNVRRSTNGISWVTSNVGTGLSSFSRNSIAYGYNRFVIVSESGAFMKQSTDAISWSTVSHNFWFTAIRTISYGDNVWVAGGSSGTMRRSTDLITWTTVTSNMQQDVSLLEYGNGAFVAHGGTMGTFNTRRSTDGITWTTVTTNFGATDIRKISYGGGFWMAVGDSGQVRKSTNGITWTTVTLNFQSASQNIYAAAYSNSVDYGDNGIWVLGASNGTVNTFRSSTDTVTWTTVAFNLGPNAIPYGLVNANELWIVGQSVPQTIKTTPVLYNDSVTIKSKNNANKLINQFSAATLYKSDLDSWRIVGDLDV